MATIKGDSLDNALNGTDLADIISGYNGNDVLNGFDGNDELYGGNGNDALTGGAGDDTLNGGDGSDSYYFSAGDGSDTIVESDSVADYVVFTNVLSTDITALYDDGKSSSLIMQFASGDQIKVQSFFSLYGAINQFQFVDKSLLLNDIATNHIGTKGDDALNGFQYANNIINGLTGNDTIHAYSGNDTFLFAKGDGKDAIKDDGGKDLVEFTDAASADVTAFWDDGANNLMIRYSGNSQIKVTGFFTIEQFHFTDTTWTLDYLASHHKGSSGNDTLTGLDNHVNVISGMDGNDTLNGANKNDTLLGGSGDDVLRGGNGSDTYIGGLGKDQYVMGETTGAQDIAKIKAGDSLITSYDIISGFTLGKSAAADQLDLDSTKIAANTTGVDGLDVGLIHSHAINNGIVSFDDVDSYSAALSGASINVADAFSYLQTNLVHGETVAFTTLNITYVFQDDGVVDTAVQLVGITATQLATTSVAGGVWLV